MEFSPERDQIVEKMFDAALKAKINLLARKYDHDLVFELWTRMAKTDCLKPYFCKWRWAPNLTINEAIDCLDDYFTGLEDLLRKRQVNGGSKHPNKKTKDVGLRPAYEY